MAKVRAFKALRPPEDKAAQTSAVPYDVVSTAEARALAAHNPYSFLHVSRPEIDLAEGIDPHSDAVYRKAIENLTSLKALAPLTEEPAPSLYVYRLRMGAHEQNGIAACCSVAEYDSGVIRKHEKTRKDKEDDRTRHILALGAQTGPVFLTYRDRSEIDGIVSQTESQPPLYDFAASDGVAHTIWRVPEQLKSALERAFQSVPLLYIADGHHRAASASRAAAASRGSDGAPSGGRDEAQFFLSVLFPASQVQILPYNRVVKDLNGLTEDEFLEALSTRFAIVADAPLAPEKKGEISIYLGGKWYGLKGRADAAVGVAEDPISSLDVSVLQDEVLGKILGIKDIRTDKRIDFVGGIRGTAYLKQLVDEGKAAVAFSLFPLSVEELISVADAGMILPPKSTWFEPKLRDGLLIHTI